MKQFLASPKLVAFAAAGILASVLAPHAASAFPANRDGFNHREIGHGSFGHSAFGNISFGRGERRGTGFGPRFPHHPSIVSERHPGRPPIDDKHPPHPRRPPIVIGHPHRWPPVIVVHRPGRIIPVGVQGAGVVGLAAAPLVQSARPLVSAQPVCGLGGSFVSVVFVPTVTASDITGFLKAYNATIADGPNADGIYRIRLASDGLPADEMKQAVESMRTQTAIVSSVAGS